MTPEKNDFWYTPPEYLEAIRAFMPGYYDPCPINPQFDGTDTRWEQDCFINPPYSAALRNAFVQQGISEYESWNIPARFLWLLNFAQNEDSWELQRRASAVFIPQKRIRFIPGHPELKASSPRYDSIFILWGNPAGFATAFGHLGKTYYQNIEEFL